MRVVETCLVMVALLSGVWYWFFLRRNQRKAFSIRDWIEASMAGEGQVLGIRWMTPSHFRTPLRLTSRMFHHASVQVEMSPHQMPLQWLWNRLKKRPEVIIFQADLDTPPAFSIDIQNFRSFARSDRSTPAGGPEWRFIRTRPFVVSSQTSWRKDLVGTMMSLAGSGNRDFLNISFRRNSPHFSVTLPLETIAPDSPDREFMLDMMRELATRSAAKLF